LLIMGTTGIGRFVECLKHSANPKNTRQSLCPM
jgi:hypothetical protein